MPDVQEVFRLVDTQDLDGLAALFAPDARFVMGNAEPLIGPDAIVAGSAAFGAMVQGFRHVPVRDWAVGPVTIIELEVTYTRLDGKEVTVPAVTIWEVDDGDLIIDYRVFVDSGPVWVP
ncbi:nuclear transport factor 2 family protein [Kribbella sp. NBC_01505]|uniref:nuclear transport factor 2 family protein n=1 Tax=Kribbella sp. NBC_01505 TaxID=2903580 RepID=UPI0038682D72